MTEIARRYFVTLNRVDPLCQTGNTYIILNDGMYVRKFFAESDEKAIGEFEGKTDEESENKVNK